MNIPFLLSHLITFWMRKFAVIPCTFLPTSTSSYCRCRLFVLTQHKTAVFHYLLHDKMWCVKDDERRKEIFFEFVDNDFFFCSIYIRVLTRKSFITFYFSLSWIFHIKAKAIEVLYLFSFHTKFRQNIPHEILLYVWQSKIFSHFLLWFDHLIRVENFLKT
jgi:hypothetical protein